MRFTGERTTDWGRRFDWTQTLRVEGRMKDGLHLDNPKPNEEWPTALIVAPSSVCEK